MWELLWNLPTESQTAGRVFDGDVMLMHAFDGDWWEKDVYFPKLFSQPQRSGSHEVPEDVTMGKLEFVLPWFCFVHLVIPISESFWLYGNYLSIPDLMTIQGFHTTSEFLGQKTSQKQVPRRVATAFGASALLLSADCCDALSHRAIRAPRYRPESCRGVPCESWTTVQHHEKQTWAEFKTLGSRYIVQHVSTLSRWEHDPTHKWKRG